MNVMITGLKMPKRCPINALIYPDGRAIITLHSGKTMECRAEEAADAIEELAKDINVPRWIPVEECRAEIPCICCDANGNMPFIPKGIVTIKDDQGLWQIDAGLADPSLHQSRLKPVLGYQNRITHWMPLPEPPKEE